MYRKKILHLKHIKMITALSCLKIFKLYTVCDISVTMANVKNNLLL